MALTFLYRDLDATDTDVTPYVVLRFGQNPQGMAENAEERSVGSWDLEIEDEGVLDLHAQRTFYVLEDDTYDTDNVLWVGQTFDKHSGRGDTWRTGPGRVYTLNLIDLNTLLERRVIQAGDDPDRPEETDVERMLWLQGLGYIGVTDDWISTDDPVDMDAVDYTGRMAAEVIEDCMGQSGKNSFMFRDPDTDTFAVFYGDSSANTDVLTSDIRLSNVLSDVDNVTTWEVLLDADQWEANSRIYSGIFASYDGGAVYQENATTVANFSHRDTTVSWPDVKSSTKANARAIRYLETIGTEEVRITCSAEVGSDQVGLFPHAGYRLQARFSHFPLFTEFTWMRILSRNTTLIGPNRYRIQYELSPGAPTSPVSCSASISAAVDSGSDTGVIPTDYPGGGSSIIPYTFSPAAPVSVPAMVIAAYWDRNAFDASGAGVTGTVGGDFSLIGSTRNAASGWGGSAFATIGICGYNAVSSGAAGDCIFDYADNWFEQARAISVSVPSSSTAPIHTGIQSGSGGIATLDGAPTPGNILVCIRFGEGEAPGLPAGLEGIMTMLKAEDIKHGTIHVMSGMIYARCVTEEDDENIAVGDSAFAHWTYVIEIAP